MTLPLIIQKSVNRYENIVVDGLTLAPVKVREADLFLIAQPALEVMQQSFPVALMRVPLLAALYQMDMEAASNGAPASGLFARALLALALSLRLGEGLEVEERINQFRLGVDTQTMPAKLVCLRFTDGDGEEKEINPAQFQKLRPIIAAQNGVTLESDEANPDIVKARKDMAAGGSANLDYDPQALISFAAAMTGADETDIADWPILKLMRRIDTYQTMLAYLVCGIGETSGMSSWKNGNPVPHPIFKRRDDGKGIATAMNSGANGNVIAKTGVQTIEAQLASKTIHSP